jgi:hypothetical protein
MRLKSKVIKYGSDEDSFIVEGLKPARLYVPEWYKKTPKFIGSGKPEIRSQGNNKTMKLCVPFLDSMITGYVVELWQDIEIVRDKKNDTFNIHWNEKPDVVTDRNPEVSPYLPVPSGHMATHFIWRTQSSIQTPRGYSCLITHPLNRFDLPFTTLSAVVDTDVNPMGKGSLPFFLKEDFEGIIPKGTPIYQVIPFKRESWTAKEDSKMHKLSQKITHMSNAVSHGFYKKTGWSRKQYE